MGGQNHPTKKMTTQTKSVESNVALEKSADISVKVVPAKAKPVPRTKPIIKKDDKTEIANKVVNNRRSADLESEDNSLYVSALEDVTDSTKKSRRSSNKVNNIFCNILFMFNIFEFTIFLQFYLFAKTSRLKFIF